MSARELITEHLDLWTGAVTKKSSSGRGSNGKVELTGVKKLRELILQLAVTGRLFEQNEKDESAATLVSKMLQIRDHLASTEGMRTKANDSVPSSDEYLSIPSSWAWVRLGNMAKFIDYRGKTPTKISAGKRLITAKNIRQGHIDLQPEEFISEADYTNWMTRGFPRKGDLLFTPEAPLGNAAIVDLDEEFALAQRAICFQWHIPETSQFMLLQILASPFQEQLVENATGMTATGIKASKLKEIPVVVPPVEEQRRIVQKVDELMALCDRLEQQASDQLEAHETLVDTLLGTLTQSENATEQADNWARLAGHFDTLFTTEQSIDKLKQTILQLAVMGRLVEQDAGDEPTESVVTKIDQELTSLVKQGQIKRPKLTPEISDNDKFFEVPDSWQWVRLGSLAIHSEAGWSPKCHDAPRDNEGWAVLKVSAVTWGEFRPGENKELPSNLRPRPEYEVHPSDFLISRANTSELVARSVVVPKGAPTKLMMSDKIIRFVFSNQVEPLYVNLFNNSPFARSYYLSVAGGTSSSMKNVSRAQIQALAVPLPPRAEQTRIVQKVDELTALCDQLKERLNQASETRCQLAEAIVEQGLSA